VAYRAGDPTDVVGGRVAAYLIDGLILGLVVGGLAAYFFFSVLVGSPRGTVTCRTSSSSSVESPTPATDPNGPRFCFEDGDRVRYVPVDDEGSLVAKIWATQAAAYLVYYVLFQGLTGATVGKLLLGLRVVRADGTNAGPLRCFARTLLLPVDGFCCGLVGFLIARSSRGHRRIGDMVGGTLVIRKSDKLAMMVARSGAALPDRATVAAAAWTASTGSATPQPAAATGAQPGVDAPMWDDARGTWIQFDRQLGSWMQWSDARGAWLPIDT